MTHLHYIWGIIYLFTAHGFCIDPYARAEFYFDKQEWHAQCFSWNDQISKEE